MFSLIKLALWAAVVKATVVRRQESSIAPTQTAGADGLRLAMGADPLYPFDPNTSAYCQWWYDNHDNSIACRDMPERMSLTEDEWLRWNPSLKSSCAAWVPETSWCIDAFSEPLPTTPARTTTRAVTTSSRTTAPPPTTTKPGNGISTPAPFQTPMVNNCNKFDKIAQGGSCQSLLDKHKLSLADFVKWNPSVGAGCNTLWSETYVCVGIVGGAGTPTTATQGANGISTPLPTQGGMVSNCDRFNLVNTGDTCASIGARNGVKSSRIIEWNKSVGSTCTSLQAKVNVCVRTIGFKPATPVSCHTATDHKTWGDNKPAALTAVVNWCDGNSSGDGSGGFATAQSKRGCYNTPFGENKIEFVARNDFGIGTSLAVAKCEEIMRASVNGCARGGTGTHEGWWFTSRVVSGRC